MARSILIMLKTRHERKARGVGGRGGEVAVAVVVGGGHKSEGGE